MHAPAMTMDATVDPAAEPDRPSKAGARPAPSAGAWSGLESGWVLAATAAAPWPLWWAIAALGVPGPHAPRTPWSFWIDGPPAPRAFHGVLALAVTLGAMVVWVHRPKGRALGRWALSVLGTGALGELLAHALTDMGRSERSLADLSDVARALTVWLSCVVIYELAPIAAAAARVSRTERRFGAADLLAHAGFVGLAALAFAWPPTAHATGATWLISPWTAAALALPLAAARSGPQREARVPRPEGRTDLLWGLAALTWLLAIGFAVVSRAELAAVPRALRFGADPATGVVLLAPALGLLLSLGAAAALLLEARRARRAPAGVVAAGSDGGFTLERNGVEEPAWVALDGGEGAAQPADGATVTLIGARPLPADAGPFRDGATQWRARRAFRGDADTLAGALTRRAAGWVAWAGVAALGVQIAAL